MKKILAFTFALFIAYNCFSQQLWTEYQNNWKHYKSDSASSTTHTLQAFYVGKENKSGFSINLFALATQSWGELSIQPTWSKQTKAGFLSVSLGAGLETSTVNPRVMASTFFQRKNTEFLFYWEQGTDSWNNNWHLAYLTQKVVQHDEGPYASMGLHSQKYGVNGFRFEIGDLNKFAVYVVLGKPTFKERSLAAMIGLRYFIL